MDRYARSRFVVFPEPGVVEVREEMTQPPQPGEIICHARTSLISIGTETFCLQGTFDRDTNWAAWVHYPFRPGYSMVAEVTSVGPQVKGLREGDRVVANIPHAEITAVRAEWAIPVPDVISDEDAAWSFLARTTQLGVRRAELELGETVGVVGLGMLGQLVVQYLQLSGCRTIIAIDPLPSRLEIAQRHGATHGLAMDVRSARPEIESLTAGKMLDAVFDVTGHPAVLAQATQLLRRRGRAILLGDTTTPSLQGIGPSVLSNSLAILAVHSNMRPEHASPFNQWTDTEMTALFFDYLQQGRMHVADLVTHRVLPHDAPRVYTELLRDRSSAIGVLFDWRADTQTESEHD